MKYIIAEDKYNPIIDKLLNNYPKIIYNKNPLDIDIGYLSQSYNLVAGRISTFLMGIIPLNNHLYNLWIYTLRNYTNNDDKNRLKIKYNIKEKIHIMPASSKYMTTMNIWLNNEFQRSLMINEKCREFD